MIPGYEMPGTLEQRRDWLAAQENEKEHKPWLGGI
jgi:hypothetical protein